MIQLNITFLALNGRYLFLQVSTVAKINMIVWNAMLTTVKVTFVAITG
jgi:hypothetical protein